MKLRLVTLCLVMVLISVIRPVGAGNITGHLLDPYGVECHHIYYGANIAGDNKHGVAYGTTTLGGLYRSNDLPGGTYSMAWQEKDGRGRMFRFGIGVPEEGDAVEEYKYRMNTYVVGNHWISPWPKEIRQSFRATGAYINQVALRTAGGRMRISIHKGDVEPLGDQIGAWREVPDSNTNTRGVYWSAGLVPTIPGEMYTVRIVTADPSAFEGVAPFVDAFKKWGGNAIPDGRTWADGKIVDVTPELCVSSDDDGIISTLSAANEYKHALGGKEFGQTFTAMGSSVVGAIFLTGDEELFALSIHDGPGADGHGGKQIGPTKYTIGVAWNGRTVTTWAPGEVPVEKGKTYFLKIRHADDSDFVIYTTKNTPGGDDQYPGGIFYNDGKPCPEYDLSGSIFEEEAPGSATVPFVTIEESEIKVSHRPRVTTVEWTTDIPCKGFVEWGEGTPYTRIHRENKIGLSHKLTIRGLERNKTYHFRVGGSGDDCRTGYSHDLTFVSYSPASANLLKNSGFETGDLSGWTKYGDEIAHVNGDKWFGKSGPHGGRYAFYRLGNETRAKGGVYQRVSVKPGRRLRASMWLYTHQHRQNWRFYDAFPYGRIGIDPTGGTDPSSDKIVWSPGVLAHGLYSNFGVEADAESDAATVFLEGCVIGNMPEGELFVIDDAVLTEEEAR